MQCLPWPEYSRGTEQQDPAQQSLRYIVKDFAMIQEIVINTPQSERPTAIEATPTR
jgi:hypothetical protein